MASARTDLHMEEYEALVQFLIELTDLIRSEHAYEYDQLLVIDQAIDIAVEDSPDAAIAYVHDVVLGHPGQDAEERGLLPGLQRGLVHGHGHSEA
jgi:hypothetical protein